nr:uncharacterized protein LOC117688566 [Crassostrea gigas]
MKNRYVIKENNQKIVSKDLIKKVHVCKSEARYCQEAVASAALVASCPASKIEWDAAACKKNCSRIASEQNCTPVDNFRYHCVINSYRNETLEVCAPSRIVFGHCVEFNLLGGVIQDQWSSPCNDTFPKCGHAYNSTAAYEYPDCYKLVYKKLKYPTTEKMSTRKIKDITKTTIADYLSIILMPTNLIFTLIFSIAIISAVVRFGKGRRFIPKSIDNIGQSSVYTDQETEAIEFHQKTEDRLLGEN